MIDWFRLALRKDILQRGIKIGVVEAARASG